MADTTTPAEYEAAVARYNAIAENAEQMKAWLVEQAKQLDAEYAAAEANLRGHESRPGIHKRYAGEPLSLADIALLDKAAVAKVAGMFPWASL